MRTVRAAMLLTVLATNPLRAEDSPPPANPPQPEISTLPPLQGSGPRVWGSAEYLFWWTNPSPVPAPLVTSGSVTDTIPGAIGQPHTQILVGNQGIGNGIIHSGGRFTFGYQPDPQGRFGVEMSYLFLGQQIGSATAASLGQVGDRTIAVPFYDATGTAGRNGIPGPSVYILGGPLAAKFFNPSDGYTLLPGVMAYYRLAVSTELQGAEANGSALLTRSNQFRLDGLLGFRWLQLDESLSFFGTGYGASGGPLQGPATSFIDRFGTVNNFYGGQFGFRSAYTTGRVTLGATAKLAMGVTHESALVDGIITTPGGTLFLNTSGTLGKYYPGGVFTQPSNLGRYHRDVFAVVPEMNLDLGYAVTSRLRLTLGYSFLCISNVARPGSSIDPTLNITRTNLADLSRATSSSTAPNNPIPFPAVPAKAPAAFGPTAPVCGFHDTVFWGQGLNFGIAYSF